MLQTPGGHRLCLGAEIASRPPEALPRTVIACYRPKPGQEAAPHALEAQSLFAEFASLGP